MMPGSPRTTRPGFTLIELLAAMSVLVILVLGVVQMLDSASFVAGSARRALETDDQARMALDYISQDVGQIVKDVNVDNYFPSVATTGTASVAMFFYTGRPGYAPANTANLSGAALTGYRINSNAAGASYNQLERYSATTQWDGNNIGSMVFLTYPTSGSFAPLSSTTLVTNPVVMPASTDTSFHVLGEDVFRLEFCYQLKDGTYSSQPVLYTKPQAWNAGTFFHTAMGAPTASDGDTTYEIGSRWYDNAAERGYICTGVKGGPSSNQAVWQAIGWQDVAALVVTVATMDKDSRTLVKNAGRDLINVAKALPTVKSGDPSAPAVTAQAAQLWLALIDSTTSTTISKLVPQKAVAGMHVYQRYVYLDAQ